MKNHFELKQWAVAAFVGTYWTHTFEDGKGRCNFVDADP
jgi:hypothetical protein